MLDPIEIDRYFGAWGRGELVFELGDKSKLVPFDFLFSAGPEKWPTLPELTMMKERSWVPTAEEGKVRGSPVMLMPAFVEGRMELIIQKLRDGYDPREIDEYVEYEDAFIDQQLRADDLAFFEDDLLAVLHHFEVLIEDGDRSPRPADDSGHPTDQELQTYRLVKRWQHLGVPDKSKPALARLAFRVRFVDETIRWTMLEMQRAKFRAGFSACVCIDSFQHKPTGTGKYEFVTDFTRGRILWPDSLRSAMSRVADGDHPIIRLPHFVIRGGVVSPTATMTPSKYESLWKMYELEELVHALAKITGDRRCLHCLAAISGSEQKRYCGEKCRSAARQARFRQRNPEGVYKAQQRYWTSMGDTEGT